MTEISLARCTLVDGSPGHDSNQESSQERNVHVERISVAAVAIVLSGPEGAAESAELQVGSNSAVRMPFCGTVRLVLEHGFTVQITAATPTD